MELSMETKTFIIPTTSLPAAKRSFSYFKKRFPMAEMKIGNNPLFKNFHEVDFSTMYRAAKVEISYELNADENGYKPFAIISKSSNGIQNKVFPLYDSIHELPAIFSFTPIKRPSSLVSYNVERNDWKVLKYNRKNPLFVFLNRMSILSNPNRKYFQKHFEKLYNLRSVLFVAFSVARNKFILESICGKADQDTAYRCYYQKVATETSMDKDVTEFWKAVKEKTDEGYFERADFSLWEEINRFLFNISTRTMISDLGRKLYIATRFEYVTEKELPVLFDAPNFFIN